MSDTKARLAALNDRQRKAMAQTVSNYSLLATIPGLAILAFVVGLQWPTERRVYDLVQFHGPESDIVAYDLSAADCVAEIERMRTMGLDVTCSNAR